MIEHQRTLEIVCVCLSLVQQLYITGKTNKSRKVGFGLRIVIHTLWFIYNMLTLQYFIMCYNIYNVSMSIRGILNNKEKK